MHATMSVCVRLCVFAFALLMVVLYSMPTFHSTPPLNCHLHPVTNISTWTYTSQNFSVPLEICFALPPLFAPLTTGDGSQKVALVLFAGDVECLTTLYKPVRKCFFCLMNINLKLYTLTLNSFQTTRKS